MSIEFEEIVLKKLDALDERTKNIETEVRNTKLELKESKQGLKYLTTKVEDNSQRLSSLEIEVKDTQEVVKCHNQSFIKFDYETNKKIDTLFNAFTTNKEKDSVHENNIVSLNAKVFNHDIRISNLENKVLTA